MHSKKEKKKTKVTLYALKVHTGPVSVVKVVYYLTPLKNLLRKIYDAHSRTSLASYIELLYT